MAGWREECTAVLKRHLATATAAKEIREIAGALERMQPYEYGPEAGSRPMPVRIVGKKKLTLKPKRKVVWRKKAAK